ncbi:MAG: heme-binding protein [Planctomycetaceae bacterium]|nr:heme-binding protein [Planctomycetaceae bacterium]
MGTQLLLIGCVGVVVVFTGCAASPIGQADLTARVRAELAAEPAESDAAVILTAAIDRAGRTAPEARGAILETALAQAKEAREFQIKEESPLPDGWPRPSLPGLIRVKTYPPVRSAWVRDPEKRNRQFMVLFRHIQDQQIAMTAPVVMEYSPSAAENPAKMDSAQAMAFLYRRTSQGQAGQAGAVVVGDERRLQVVSVGRKGSYGEANFRRALTDLRQWLSTHPHWRPAGPPRVLAYNSPFMLFWQKYSEVQLPIEPAGAQSPATLPAGGPSGP